MSVVPYVLNARPSSGRLDDFAGRLKVRRPAADLLRKPAANIMFDSMRCVAMPANVVIHKRPQVRKSCNDIETIDNFVLFYQVQRVAQQLANGFIVMHCFTGISLCEGVIMC
jgi:hypothetical protein